MARLGFKAPIYVDLSITDACNLNCSYCYADAGPLKINNFKFTDIKNLFDKLSSMGVHYVRIAGGEPLLHPDILKILNAACEAPFLTSMSTNGILLDKSFVSKLKTMNFPWVVVSIDGNNQTINNRTRGQWEKAENGIRLLVDGGIKTKTATVLTSKNADHIKDIILYLEELGVTSAGFLLFCPVGRGGNKLNELELSKKQLENVIIEITKYKANKNKKMEVNFVPPHESSIPRELSEFLDEKQLKDYWNLYIDKNNYKREIGCKAGISTCAIDSYGNVYGCEQLMNFEIFKAGNVKEKDFQEIWENGEGFKILRDIDYEKLDSTCKECKHVGCGGGCRAVAYQRYGILTKLDPRCKLK